MPPGGCVIDVIEEVQTHYPELKSGYATAFFEGNELDMDFKISDIIMSVTCRNPILIKSLLLSVPTQGECACNYCILALYIRSVHNFLWVLKTTLLP